MILVIYELWAHDTYEVATISRLPKNTDLFCKRTLEKRLYSAKETYIFQEPTNHSHPIWALVIIYERYQLIDDLKSPIEKTTFCKRVPYFPGAY